MAVLSSLLDRVHDELPSVPEALALRALSDATREFCTRTHAWQAPVPRVTLREGRRQYQLYPDIGLQVVALKEVRYNDRRLTAVPVEKLRRAFTTPQSAEPTAYAQTSATSLELAAPASSEGRLTVLAALTLALNSVESELPDVLVDEWGEAIASGAKSRLVRQASQPWYAPDAAVIYSVPFYTAINEAKLRTMTSLGQAELQIEMRGWV